MKILSWNIRGAGKKGSLTQLKHVIDCNKPEVLVLMETRINSSKACKLISKTNFPNFVEIPPEGYSGGIWFL